MTRKRCRRRRHDLDLNPVRLAVIGADEATCREDHRLLRAAELIALAMLREGTATAREWRLIERTCRIAAELARAGIGPEVQPLCAEVAAALRESGAARLQAAALAALVELVDLHEQQRRLATRAELERAVSRVVAGLA